MFEKIIKEIIAESGLSQEKFAKSVSVSQGTVSKWISGAQEPRYSQLVQICQTYKLDANYILGIKEY